MSAPRQIIEILLQPGDFYFSTDRNTRIRTLLGSCVSVTFWHPRLRLGGMSHFILPSRRPPRTVPQTELDGRYADESFRLFARELRQLSLPASQFQIKLFGGAAMFEAKHQTGYIGELNIAAARAALAQMSLTEHSAHVGGHSHRNLKFELWSGDVWVRQQTTS